MTHKELDNIDIQITSIIIYEFIPVYWWLPALFWQPLLHHEQLYAFHSPSQRKKVINLITIISSKIIKIEQSNNIDIL